MKLMYLFLILFLCTTVSLKPMDGLLIDHGSNNYPRSSCFTKVCVAKYAVVAKYAAIVGTIGIIIYGASWAYKKIMSKVDDAVDQVAPAIQKIDELASTMNSLKGLIEGCPNTMRAYGPFVLAALQSCRAENGCINN